MTWISWQTFSEKCARVKPERDDKLKALIKLLKTDSVLKSQKVIIFTEFADTARYLEQELNRAGIEGNHAHRWQQHPETPQ